MAFEEQHHEIKKTFIERKDEEQHEAPKILSAPANLWWDEFQEREYRKERICREIEALREQVRQLGGQLGEHVSWMDQVDYFQSADEKSSFKERITNTQNVMDDICSVFDKEIDWIIHGRKAQEDVKNEVVEEQPYESATATPPVSPLNRDMQPHLSRALCTASNCVQVTWMIDEKKLSGKKTSFSSPDFEFREGRRFLLIVRTCPQNVKGGFQACRGVGRVELKFCGGTDLSEKVHYRVAVGHKKQLPFQGLDHDFSTQHLSILPHAWDFLSTVNKGFVLLHLEVPLVDSSS